LKSTDLCRDLKNNQKTKRTDFRTLFVCYQGKIRFTLPVVVSFVVFGRSRVVVTFVVVVFIGRPVNTGALSVLTDEVVISKSCGSFAVVVT